MRGDVKNVSNTNTINIPSIIDKITLNIYSFLGSVMIYIIKCDFFGDNRQVFYDIYNIHRLYLCKLQIRLLY